MLLVPTSPTCSTTARYLNCFTVLLGVMWPGLLPPTQWPVEEKGWVGSLSLGWLLACMSGRVKQLPLYEGLHFMYLVGGGGAWQCLPSEVWQPLTITIVSP